MTNRQKTTWRPILFIAVLLFAGAGAAYQASGDRVTESEPVAEPKSHEVDTVRLERVESFLQRRAYTGIIVARRTTDLGFDRSARITELLVDEGDAVEQGQVIGHLDVRHLDAQERQVTAQRNSARALLAELETGTRPETLASARALRDELKSQVELRTRDNNRTVQLHKKGTATEQVRDNSELGLEAATARLAAAQSQLDELEAGPRQEQKDAQRAEVEKLDAQLHSIELEREDSVLKAPFSGRISARYVDEGAVAAVGQPVFRLVEDQILEVRVGVPVETARNLNPGETYFLKAGVEDIPTELARILPEVDLQTRTQTVIFDVAAEAVRTVAPGQIARFEATTAAHATGFWVPKSALAPLEQGLWSVYALVPSGNKYVIERRPVQKMLHTDRDRPLRSGTLLDGEFVVASGLQKVVPGQTVTASNATN